MKQFKCSVLEVLNNESKMHIDLTQSIPLVKIESDHTFLTVNNCV
jgi:hypothetical protein